MEPEIKWTIYQDKLQGNGNVLMGYRGNSLMDAGYFYAPYIPLTSTPTVLPPGTPPVTPPNGPGDDEPWTNQQKQDQIHRSIYEDWQISQDG